MPTSDALDVSQDDIPPPPPSMVYPSSLDNTQTVQPPFQQRPPSSHSDKRLDPSSITPPPQAPFYLSHSQSGTQLLSRPPSSSTATQRGQLASPAPLPPLAHHQDTALASRPSVSSAGRSSLLDQDYPTEDRDRWAPLPTTKRHGQEEGDWGENSHTSTVFRHETWGRSSYDGHSNQQQQGRDDMQCNQSLSEMFPSTMLAAAQTAHNPPSSDNNDDADLGGGSGTDGQGSMTSPFAQTERRLSRIEDFLRGDVATFSASVDPSDRNTVHQRTLLVEREDTADRTLDEIIRENAEEEEAAVVPPMKNNSLSSSRPNTAASTAQPSISQPTIELSPAKHTDFDGMKANTNTNMNRSAPQQALASPNLHQRLPAGASDTAVRKGNVVSDSLREDLLASEAGEDFLRYAQRAYMVCIYTYLFWFL